jgi:uncharacterized protein (DUF736 family)
MDAELETQAKEIIMSNIGTFTKSGDTFNGEIVSIGFQSKNVRILPENPSTNENAPSHKVFVGAIELGAAWSKTSREGRKYLSLKLDAPSFAAPIYASLFDEDDGETYNLIWTRNPQTNGG